MTSVSWHGSIKIMTSYQMVWCHNCFYLKLWGTTIKLKKRFFVKFGGTSSIVNKESWLSVVYFLPYCTSAFLAL